MKEKVIAVLVDGSNLYAANKALGFTTDYSKLLNFFEGTLLRAVYFTAMPPKEEQSTLRPMVDYLEYNGWSVCQKTTKEFVDPITNEVKVKGNMDIEIGVTAMELAPHVTDIVLFSGDGDFKFLIDSLQRHHGVRVTVVSTKATRPSMIADELRRQADLFIDLVDIQPHIKRDGDEKEDVVKLKRHRFMNGG